MNWANKILAYNRGLAFNAKLPRGVSIMNPYAESPVALKVSDAFYLKYYSDNTPRKLILGINPGRHGAGATGIPFTDPKRLVDNVKINWNGAHSHEPSSVYIYDMIEAYGGPEAFYGRYFINSVSPLGFTIRKNGKEVNYNYYDSPELQKRVMPFILSNLDTLRVMDFDMETVYCLGVRNAKYLAEINARTKVFGSIVPLEHPRYIMQYKLRSKEDYIRKYLSVLLTH
jgi:hypothetical protein